jgi:hypothetical protein
MIISINKTSNFCGLTYKNLQLPGMQNYLRSLGCEITFSGTEEVSIKVGKGLNFNHHLSNQIKKIELSAQHEINNRNVHLSPKLNTKGNDVGFNALLISSLLITAASVGACFIFTASMYLMAFTVIFSAISLLLTGLYFIPYNNGSPVQKKKDNSSNELYDSSGDISELNESVNCGYQENNSQNSYNIKYLDLDFESRPWMKEINSADCQWEESKKEIEKSTQVLFQRFESESKEHLEKLKRIEQQSWSEHLNQPNRQHQIGFFREEYPSTLLYKMIEKDFNNLPIYSFK